MTKVEPTTKHASKQTCTHMDDSHNCVHTQPLHIHPAQSFAD